MRLTAIFVLALVGIAVAQSVAPIPREVRLMGEIPAEWWSLVELELQNGAPANSFTVPHGNHFVVTRTDSSSTVHADGQPVTRLLEVVDASSGNLAFNAASYTRVAFGPGTVLDARSAGGGTASFRLWGYLEPVR